MKKKENKKIYLILFSVLSIIMCIGYASINSVVLDILGTAKAKVSEEIYITQVDVIYDASDTNDDEASASINLYDATYLSSRVILPDDNENGYITYQITIYNNNSYDQMFRKVEYTIAEDSYDNPNIVFDDLNGLKSGDVLQSKASVTFTMKFHYKDYVLAESNVLNANMNFLFMKSYEGESISNMMIDQAKPDNTSSRFVESPQGINFSLAASDTNGKGIYVMADTLEDENPIYYYRGAVDYNNIIFGDYCWKLVRTTDTGGTKMIFNGLKSEDGKCINEGLDTELYYNKVFNTEKLTGVGYNYSTSTLPLSSKADSSITAGTIFAYDAIWDETKQKYVLTGDMYTSDANFTTEKYEKLKNHHYTCFSTTETECETVDFVYMARDAGLYTIRLTNNKWADDYLDAEFSGTSINQNKSEIRKTIDTWYSEKMTDLTPYLEDTVYCNDRSIYSKLGWEKNGGIYNDHESKLAFGAKGRTMFASSPSVECQNVEDSFTMDNTIGNGLLDYPVALLTLDEGNLAGVSWNEENNTHYLNNGYVWWTMSPGFLSANSTYVGVIYSLLDHVALNYTSGNAGGVRPVISLKPNTIIQGGYGTPESPFVIEDTPFVEPSTDPSCFEFDESTGTITKYLCADFETQYPNNTIYDVVIPKSINGTTVKRIDGYAFEGTAVYTVEIPSTVEEIEPYAFDYAPLLYNVINKTGKEFDWGYDVMTTGDYQNETNFFKITSERVEYDLSNFFTLNIMDYEDFVLETVVANDTKGYDLYVTMEYGDYIKLNKNDILYGDYVSEALSNKNKYSIEPAINNTLNSNKKYNVVPIFKAYVDCYNIIEIRDGDELLYSHELVFRIMNEIS